MNTLHFSHKRGSISELVLSYCLFLCLLLQPHIVLSQVAKMQWGPDIEAERKLYPNRFVGKDDRAIYFIKDTYNPFCPSCPKDHYLEKFDAESMSFIFSKELKMPEIEGNRHVQFEELFYLNGQLILFTSFYNKETKLSQAFAQHINASGEIENDRQLIDQIELTDKGERSDFSFVLSSDSSMILEFKNDYSKRGKNLNFAFKVIDNSLNALFGNARVMLPFSNPNFTIHDYILDKSGNLYMLTELEGEKGNWFKDRPSYLYKILLIEAHSDVVKEFDVQLEGKTISDMSFRVNQNQDLIAAGFFSNRGRYSDEIAGTFYLSLDGKTKEVKNSGLKEFDKSFLLNFMSDRKAKRGDELREFKIDQIIERKDGGAYMVAEQRYIQTITSYNGRYVTTDYYYNFNDLIVASINVDGRINWVKTVPKTQVTVNDKGPYSSYSMGISENTINFIFNDNTRNLKIPNPRDYRTFSGPKKSTCVLVTLDENGDMKKRPLFAERDKKIFARPKIYLQTSPKELLMYTDRGRVFKLLKVGFE
ncbi:MAG: hypothetical protein IPP32_05425 [Bacteroidetes bacterium]|nr:hypothetical protein [Bacteroidota bacterium]